MELGKSSLSPDDRQRSLKRISDVSQKSSEYEGSKCQKIADTNDKNLQCETKREVTKSCDDKDEKEKESTHTLHFEHVITFDIKCSDCKPWISSVKPLPNGNVIMADFNNSKLYIYNKSQERQKAVNVPGKPCSVAVINDNKVAVTLHEKNTVALINVMTRKVYKFIDAGDYCHGVTQNIENIVLNCLEDGLKFMDLNGSVHRVIPEVRGEAYLCTSENQNIYCSVYWSHRILCFNKDGDEMYSFSNLTMKCPRGISVDEKGQVYTVEFGKNKIHALNSEGTKSRVILNKKHGINNPLCVMFYDSCLYVSNNDGEAVTIFKTT